jgi:hypothetical protein
MPDPLQDPLLSAPIPSSSRLRCCFQDRFRSLMSLLGKKRDLLGSLLGVFLPALLSVLRMVSLVETR